MEAYRAEQTNWSPESLVASGGSVASGRWRLVSSKAVMHPHFRLLQKLQCIVQIGACGKRSVVVIWNRHFVLVAEWASKITVSRSGSRWEQLLWPLGRAASRCHFWGCVDPSLFSSASTRQSHLSCCFIEGMSTSIASTITWLSDGIAWTFINAVWELAACIWR